MQLLSATTHAGVFTQTPTPSHVVERVRGEFKEMPGLVLTLAQAGRLWGLDAETCSDVLSRLVAAGFLCRRSDGSFCRVTAVN